MQEFCACSVFSSVSKENPKRTGDGKNYDQSQSLYKKNLQKRQSKLQVRYVQTTRKENRKKSKNFSFFLAFICMERTGVCGVDDISSCSLGQVVGFLSRQLVALAALQGDNVGHS